jgi:hypothetical protein
MTAADINREVNTAELSQSNDVRDELRDDELERIVGGSQSGKHIPNVVIELC